MCVKKKVIIQILSFERIVKTITQLESFRPLALGFIAAHKSIRSNDESFFLNDPLLLSGFLKAINLKSFRKGKSIDCSRVFRSTKKRDGIITNRFDFAIAVYSKPHQSI